MKNFYKLVFFVFLLPATAFATHIVGGELYLIDRKTSDYRFTLGLNLYFDDINGNPQAEDAQITVSIYRKSDNELMGNYVLPRVSNNYISYNSPACTVTNLRTRILGYGIDIYMSPVDFSDSQGYYAVWERCCRNNTIININTPGAVGNAFFMEFPPVTDTRGNRIYNSSPQFPVIRGDYACINTPFRFPFGATDPDNDQLFYYLATPFKGNSSTSSPIPAQNASLSGGTYPLVSWATGYGLSNIIPGTDPVKVNSSTGEISFTANQIGLYVFSVVCEEYRSGRKIGSVRRDFQIAVLDCPKNLAPSMGMKQNNRNIARNSTIKVKTTDSRCFDVLLNDQFVAGSGSTGSLLNVRVISTNFPAGYVSLSPVSGTVSNNTDTLRSKLCWANCAINPPGQPFALQLVVSDQGCPFPLTDTLKVQFDFDPKPNIPSAIQTLPAISQATVIAGGKLDFTVLGINHDQDSVSIEAIGRGFNLAGAGMTFANLPNSTADSLKLPFNWNPDCTVKTGNTYIVDFIIKERRCGKIKPDTVTVKLIFQPRISKPPVVITTLPGNVADKLIGETIAFDVIATDPENDLVTVRAVPRGFLLADVGMVYETPKSGKGRMVIPFLWQIPCNALNAVNSDNFIIDFVAEDNSCQPNRFDSVRVTLSVRDLKVSYDFLPVNLFTPNPEIDTLNSYFEIPDLPADNCDDKFDRVEIYNRWGKQVFRTQDRHFRWEAKNFPNGGYFYLVYYEKRRWRGFVNVMR